MYFLKTNSESFERNFGKVTYPKSDPKTNTRLIFVVLSLLVIVIMRSNGGVEFDKDTLSLILLLGVSLFFTLFSGPIHSRYLTTKGVLIRSSIVKKDVFIPWEEITKVLITEDYLAIEFFDIKGKKYGFNYSTRRSRRNNLFEPFMENLKKFRPDLKETYVKYDYKDLIAELKEGLKASPWFVIIGIFIFIFILITST